MMECQRFRRNDAYLLGFVLFPVLLAESARGQLLQFEPAECYGRQRFGHSVAIAGDVALIGGPTVRNSARPGTVTTYDRREVGWVRGQILTPHGPEVDNAFGTVVAVSGTTMVIGGRRVYVYEREGTDWLPTAILEDPHRDQNSAFGQAVALSNQWLIVGAPMAVASQLSSGAAYAYRRQGKDWAMAQEFQQLGIGTTRRFGASLALDGATLLVGAPLQRERFNSQGAVFHFTLDDSGWRYKGKITAPDGRDGDRFGTALGVVAGHILIGAPNRRTIHDRFDGLCLAGAVYAYEWNGTILRHRQTIEFVESICGGAFGAGIAMSKTVAVIGAPGYWLMCDARKPSLCPGGFAYGIAFHEGRWVGQGTLGARVGYFGDALGASVATDGAAILVGAPDELGACAVEKQLDSGSAYLADTYFSDCNRNGLADAVELNSGASDDCNVNARPDECEFGGGLDCNSNGTPDLCEPAEIADCNWNGVSDSCEIASNSGFDCNANRILDACERPPLGTLSRDCNANSNPDVCDIAEGTSVLVQREMEFTPV